VLEIIEIFVSYNSNNKNGDKVKIRQFVSQLFNNFLEFKPRANPGLLKYGLDGSLVAAVDGIEKRLFKHNFSYAKCVKDKIDAKGAADSKGSGDSKKSEGEEEPNQDDMDLEDTTKNNGNKEGKQDFNDKKDGDVSKIDNEDDDEKENDGQEKLKNGDTANADNGKKDEDFKEDPNNLSSDERDDREDSFDKYLKSNSNDSQKEFHTRPMIYKSQLEISEEKPSANSFITFLPRPVTKSKLFFGGHQFYVCLRFYYTLFERFLKAMELSAEIPTTEDTRVYGEEERQRLAIERYDTFKEILKLYLKESFDSNIYEDCLRCIFGRDAGFLFSIDKIVNNIIKNLPTDDLSSFVLESRKELFSSPEEPDVVAESIKFSTISQKLR